MPRFAKPENQATKAAAHIGKQLNGKIQSVGTIRNYQQALKSVALNEIKQGRDVRDLTPACAQAYLSQRADQVSQSTLNMERQAIQAMMHHVTGQLELSDRLEVTQSTQETTLQSRAYTPEQVQEIANFQAPQNALATQIAYAAGLRAHELITLERAELRPADERPALEDKFLHREGELYTVVGKGGLCREVLIPKDLAEQLESRRLTEPQQVTDRGIHYEKNYEIGSGRAFSQSFSRASEEQLGWSHGAHGLRHSYAQERMDELRDHGAERTHALEVVSQELGHFRPEITETYLR